MSSSHNELYFKIWSEHLILSVIFVNISGTSSLLKIENVEDSTIFLFILMWWGDNWERGLWMCQIL